MESSFWVQAQLGRDGEIVIEPYSGNCRAERAAAALRIAAVVSAAVRDAGKRPP